MVWLDTLKLAALSIGLFTDVVTSTFVVPFLATALLERGFSPFAIALCQSAFSIAALVGYILLLAIQMASPPDPNAAASHYTRRCWYLAGASASVATGCILVVFFNGAYFVVFCCACVQGVSSAVVWTYCMSLAGTLPKICNMDSLAFVIAGSSLGELCGPWLGTAFYQIWPSLGPSYLPMAGLSLANMSLALAVIFLHNRYHPRATASSAGSSDDADAFTSLSKAQYGSGGGGSGGGGESIDVDGLGTAHSRSAPNDVTQELAPRDTCCQRLQPVGLLLTHATFLRLSMLLLISSVPRALLDIMLPIFLHDEFEASVLEIGTVFGFGSFFYVFGSLVAGRFVTSSKHPMRMVNLLIMVMGVAAVMMLYVPSLPLVTAAFCVAATILVFTNVVACNRLEALGADGKWNDPLMNDRIMAIACFFWTGGFAVGGLLAGIPETPDEQRFMILCAAAAVALYACTLIPVYGWAKWACCSKTGAHIPIASDDRISTVTDDHAALLPGSSSPPSSSA